MKSPHVLFSLAIAIGASFLSAAPIIQFDRKTFDFGTIVEGKNEIFKTVFNVKNAGDAVLKFESVRSSCGCVVARYDSAIGSGATGHIETFMNTKGFHSGAVNKWIEVSSNAKNEPTVRLAIKAVFQAHIDVLKKNYLSFNESKNNKDTLYLATKKADFKILGAEFRAYDSASDNADWQTNLPVVIAVNPLTKDSNRADGKKVFCFELVSPIVKQSRLGDVTITTNHPKKPKIALETTLLK